MGSSVSRESPRHPSISPAVRPLSRRYFDHRFSDDIDLFTNDDRLYAEHVQALIDAWEAAQPRGGWRVDRLRQLRAAAYTQVFIVRTVGDRTIDLRVDLVNDVVPRFGEHVPDPVLGPVDNLRNILSNKLAAVYRFEPKDLADIREIALHLGFDWVSVVAEAKQKEAGVDPRSLFNILSSVPAVELAQVRWTRDVDIERVREDLSRIAADVLHGRENTLYQASA